MRPLPPHFVQLAIAQRHGSAPADGTVSGRASGRRSAFRGAALPGVRHLHLLYEARGNLLSNNLHATTLALCTHFEVIAAPSAGTAAFWTDHLLIDLHLYAAPIVDVLQGNRQIDHNVAGLVLALLLAKAAAEKLLKRIERIRGTVAALLQTLLAVLVVDASLLIITEHFVRCVADDESAAHRTPERPPRPDAVPSAISLNFSAAAASPWLRSGW